MGLVVELTEIKRFESVIAQPSAATAIPTCRRRLDPSSVPPTM
jgi:hypothetical protein